MKKIFTNNSYGQTMVEYLLLMVVVIAVSRSVFDKIEKNLISGPNSFQNRYLGGFSDTFNAGNDEQSRFERFSIRR